MSFVDIKCPNCGASIQLDASREVGYCSYCGSKVQIQKEIKRLKIDKSSDLENLIKLAEIECEMGQKHWEQLAEYSQKIIEIDANNLEGWKYKFIAAKYKLAETTKSFDDFIFIGNKLIELDSSPSQREFVYEGWLEDIAAVLVSTSKECQKLEEWYKDRYEEALDEDIKTAASVTAMEDEGISGIVNDIAACVNIRTYIPADAISNSKKLSKAAAKAINAFIKSEKAVNHRLGVYDCFIAQEELDSKWNVWLDSMKSGVPQEFILEEYRDYRFTSYRIYNALKQKKKEETEQENAGKGCAWIFYSIIPLAFAYVTFSIETWEVCAFFGVIGIICLWVAFSKMFK